MIIKVRNLLDQTAQFSFLTFGESSGVGTVRVKNINPYSASWAVQFGKTGEGQSEIKVLGTAAPSGTSVVLTSNTLYDHPADTPLYAIKYDKLVIKRSTSGTAGTATALTGGTISITPNSDYTQYDDTTGASGYAYRAAFFNSVTGETSSDSDWLTTSGFSFYSLASLRERTKNKLFSSGYLKSDAVVDEWINEWLEIMNRAAIKVNQSYSLGTTEVAFGTSGLGTITATDFVARGLKTFWITFDGVETFRATLKDRSEVFPNEIYVTTHPYYVWRDDAVFQTLPGETGGTASIEYSQNITPMVNDTDELPLVFRPYSSSFVNYALAEAYYNDEKDAKGDRYLTRANSEKQEFINEVTPRDYTGIKTIELTDVISAQEDFFV